MSSVSLIVSLIASWGHIRDKIGIVDPYSSTLYCPSMSQILSYSSKIAIRGSNDIHFVSGYYSNNQLVELSDISYKTDSGAPAPTPKTYTITGVINNLTGSGNWVLQDSDRFKLDSGKVSGPGEFEITYTGYDKPYYLEIVILDEFDDLNYINDNHNTGLTFNSNNLCSLGILTWENA